MLQTLKGQIYCAHRLPGPKNHFNTENQDASELIAVGVEFISSGSNYTVKVLKEVLVCGGSICSPEILELSGIGSSEILKKHNVKCLLNNPGVGENLQDHTATALSWQVNDGVPTFETMLHDHTLQAEAMNAYKQSKTSPLAAGSSCHGFLATSSLFPDLPREKTRSFFESLNASAPKNAYLTIIEPILFDALARDTDAVAQLIAIANPTKCDTTLGPFFHTYPENYMLLAVCITRPFSRGPVHIKSSSPKGHPRIDPAYLSHPIDISVVTQDVLHLYNLIKTGPLVDFIKKDENGELLTMPSFKIPKTAEEARELAFDKT